MQVSAACILFLCVDMRPVEDWEPLCPIVAGKIVNCYSKKDWVLRFLLRSTTFGVECSHVQALSHPSQMDIAGIDGVKCSRVENLDVSCFVEGHSEYPEAMPLLLAYVGRFAKTQKGCWHR